jgi:hypothetical protein
MSATGPKMTDPYKPPETRPQRSDPGRVRFPFVTEGHTVVAAGELGTGREWVEVDDEVVSRARTYRLLSRHPIRVDGRDYQVVYRVRNPFTGVMRCSLFAGDQELHRYRCTIRPNNRVLVVAWVGFVLALFGLNILASWYGVRGDLGLIAGGLFLLTLLGSGHLAARRGYAEIMDEPVD